MGVFKNRRLLLVLFLIALIAIIYWGWRKYTQHPTSSSTPPPESVTTPGLSTYTNSTFGYSLTLPTTWIATPATFDDPSSTAAQRDAAINFAGERLFFTLQTESKQKYPGLSLEQFARESVTPKDKITISEVTPQQIGSTSGIREKITTSDNTYSGLVYFTEDATNFYSFYTYELEESAEVTTVLSTFRIK